MVTSLSLTGGPRQGMLASLGVLAANAGYFAAVATGLGALIAGSSQAFSVLRWAGAAYLVAIGVRTFVRASRRCAEHGAGAAPAGSAPTRSAAACFRHGLVTQGANASLLVYFSALLPQFLDDEHPLLGQVALLAATSAAIELAVLSGYALLAARAGGLARRPALESSLRRAGGALLVAAGMRLALTRDAE
jgi:threonine/homoserine/homoserine lactone efflux protein